MPPKKPLTKTEATIEAIAEALAANEVEVRTERLIGAGGIIVHSGLALVEDKWVIFIEKRNKPQARLDALLDSLNQLRREGFNLGRLNLEPETSELVQSRLDWD